jgi:protein arginine N-methyltransferase 1
MRTYDLEMYGRMMVDPGRERAYAEALRRTVRPGSVVLDIGTGTGAHAMLAAKLGASRVIAVEPDDVIELARVFARRNGLQDRIDFVQGVSQDLQLECQADVIVSDLRGSLPLFGRHFPSIADARERLLAPGGVLLPTRDTLQAAVVQAPARWSELHAPWQADVDGLDFSYARPLATATWTGFGAYQPQAIDMLSEVGSWGTVDYTTVTAGSFDGSVQLEAHREGTAHGLCLWFDAEVLPGLGYANTPGTGSVYGQVFAPWPEPVHLSVGTAVELAVRARLVGFGHLIEWRTRIARGRGPDQVFAQSNFGALPLPRDRMARRQRVATPEVTVDGRVARTVIDRLDGRRPLQQIAEELLKAFPGRYDDADDALHEVGDLAERYGA